MKRRDLVQSHSNRVLFIARWFGCLETCPTDHRVKVCECHPLDNTQVTGGGGSYGPNIGFSCILLLSLDRYFFKLFNYRIRFF